MAITSGTENNGGSVSSAVASANESAIPRLIKTILIVSAYSMTSSGDAHSGLSHSVEWPEVDGVSAGRAAALGALCRIICSKKSKETITDSQLAQFYKVIYEALLEKDRLILCALIYFGGGIFRLSLKSVEILLPQFVQTLEMIYTESMKSRLHPSIDEVQMRRACLNALSSIISWPTTFGNMFINGNANQNSFTYIEVRPWMHRILITALRNEVDPMNLFLTLSIVYFITRLLIKKLISEIADCCASIVRSIVSAVCDNLCKPQWSSELSVCLAALDFLNALSTIHQSVLFSENDLSTGILIITSLCRFIDAQLMKPPPLHSKDLHSSVVAAYFSLSVWLCAAPTLLETESCLTTVAETIELGLTGGKNLPPMERKAASKRVDDAAESLLYMIFSGHGRQDDIMDEKRLLHKFGNQAIDITKFRHFLVRQQTLISIHEATKLSTISKESEVSRPSTNCSASRVLLYDLGLISEESYESGDILLLDSSNLDFYHDLHHMVDRSPTKLLQTVRLFYVRDGQRSAVDILANAMNLQNTSNLFCSLLAELGEGVEVETHPHWTGDWTTAFSAERKLEEAKENLDNYIIDGFTHCLWWTDPHIEIAFTTPTERIRKQQESATKCNELTTCGTNISVISSDEHSDSDHAARMLQRDFAYPYYSGYNSLRSFDQRVYVIFLERIEDMHYFPCGSF
uniref:Bm3056, isoform b n=1 Tax=Brugia malayi TaxID=6279 RepID=A0A1I9G0C4_BRUMA|nr:Bm3056, isoform b [Brugia malayi]